MARTRPSTCLYAVLAAVAAAVLLSASPLAAQYKGFGKNKVQYRDFRWHIYHSPHFDVYYYEAEEHLLKKVVSFAESAYDQLSREFDYQIQEPTPLIFYATHSAFEQNNIIVNFIPEGVAAFASPVRNRMVLPVDMPDPELMALLLHELTHIFQYHILYQGSLAKAATLRPPQWFMEGMASYMAKDEGPHDKMVLRDAVVNDNIPSASQGNVSGYFAYRFGHAVFDYIEERWGKEGFLDFIYEFRNTIGSRPERAIQRAFRIDPEDFDLDLRRWLRKKYLRQLVETGEPSDFGRPFRVEHQSGTQEISPVGSPSGDLVAALSVQRADIDVVLFDSRRRRQLKSLTRGYTTEYRYLAAQGLAVARQMGRDLSFSPDGNYVAAFARQEGGRNLLLFDVLNGGIARSIPMNVEQQLAPAFSPDGSRVAFSGNRGGHFDLFVLDLETEEVTQLTDDPVYDGSPTFSPDGESLIFSSVVGEYAKLFRIDLDDPTRRYQVTTGESNDRDAVFAPDGRHLYFTSDRDGYDNIFGLDLESGELRQYTDVVTGCFMPAVLEQPDGRESLVYAGLWDGDFKLYLTDLEEPVTEPELVEVVAPEPEPFLAEELERFEPAIEVSVDDANKERYKGRKFILTDAQTYLGVDDNQTYLGRVLLTFSDYLGDRRILVSLSSYDALSNFDVVYADLSDRWQWSVHLFDDRDFFFVSIDPFTGQIIDRRNEIRFTGALASVTYPFTFSTRFEVGGGYIYRKLEIPVLRFQPGAGFGIDTISREDDFPYFFTALVGDSAVYAPWAPVSGRRWRIDLNYAPDLDASGTLTAQASADFRQYIPLTLRSGFAFRAFAGAAEGTDATPFYFGGDSFRGFRYRGLSGDRVFFTNMELRFPLLDVVATPVLAFRGIRGRFFLDVGGNWYSDFEDFDFYNEDESRLEDGIAAYGWGFTLRFVGLDLNWDYAKLWDFDKTLSGSRTTFYIGYRF